jgi:hypothetical protein
MHYTPICQVVNNILLKLMLTCGILQRDKLAIMGKISKFSANSVQRLNKLQLVAFSLAFASIGTYLVLSSSAATPNAVEAEGSTITAPA